MRFPATHLALEAVRCELRHLPVDQGRRIESRDGLPDDRDHGCEPRWLEAHARAAAARGGCDRSTDAHEIPPTTTTTLAGTMHDNAQVVVRDNP